MIGEFTIKRITTAMEDNLKKELRDQGHYLTGALEASIKSKARNNGGTLAFEMEASDYANDLFEGVRPEHIDYQKHLTAMVEYAKKRMKATGKEALRIGAAIAKKHSKEGIPTKSSYQFSNTGERLFANVESFNKNESELLSTLESTSSDEINKFIDKTFDQTIF